jgi:hypothetical protein
MSLIDGQVYPEGVTPFHVHQWGVEDDGTYDGTIIGLACSASWLIPPGPKGKKPRCRGCCERIDMDGLVMLAQMACPNTDWRTPERSGDE